MIRTTHLIDRRCHRRRAATAVIALALAAATACGDKIESRPSTSVESAIPPVVAHVDSTTGTSATGVVVPANVSFEEAEATYAQGRYGDAVEMFDGYVRRRPDNPWGHYMLGLSAWKAGQLDRAETAFEGALELDPKHVKSLLNLSRVLLEQDRANEAAKHATAALEIDSTSADVHRVVGRARAALGQSEVALESYRTALSLDPEDVWSMNNMGLVLIRQARYEEALGPLARAVQRDSAVAAFQNNLGIALERTGRHIAAAEAYRAALGVDSTYRKAAASLARVEGRADDPTVGPVELRLLAEDFDREVQSWRAARLTSIAPSVPSAPREEPPQR